LGQETPAPAPPLTKSPLARPAAAALYCVATLLVGSAAMLAVYRAHTDRMELTTGRAEWIWYPNESSQPSPIAFTATRDFALPSSPAHARAKLFVDREHVLFVNGVRAGSGVQSRGDPLAIYDVAPLLRAGANRIAIEAASPTGIGGILFSLDVEGFGRDALVSDGLWRVGLSSASSSGETRRPEVWGRPPQYPWGYPRLPRPEELARPTP
jgi:hypothetical protein